MGKGNKKLAYISAALIALLVVCIIAVVCILMKEEFQDTEFMKIFPGASTTKRLFENTRAFGPPWDQGRPLHGPNQPFTQMTSPDLKGTSVVTVDSLGTGRNPIVIEWAKNWYNLP